MLHIMLIMLITSGQGGKQMAKSVLIRDFPEDLHIKAKVQAAKEQTTLKGIIIKALEQYLKTVGG